MATKDQGTTDPGMNDDRGGNGGGRDAGPTVRRMSPQVRGHARGTLLAETSRTTLSDPTLSDATLSSEGEATGADGANFGWDGLDDAPAPLKKRWVVVAAGLAVAAAGAAIIAGTGLISSDDLGLSAADSTQSPDEAGDEAIGNGPESGGISTLIQARGDCLDSERSPGIDESAVVFEHQTKDYAAVVVSHDGLTLMCATSGRGKYSAEYGSGAGTDPITVLIRQTIPQGKDYLEMLGGKVADDITAVQIQSGGDPVAEAHLENGWFSAFATTTPGEELSYLVTMKDGTSETLLVDDPFSYVDPVERQEMLDEANRGFAEACFSDRGITLAEAPSEGDEEAQPSGDDFLLLSAHLQPSYRAAIAANATEVAVCASAMSETTWSATQPAAMPENAPIAPFELSPAPTDKGPYPVIGQAAPDVTSVDVVRADGRRRETYLQDGFYSLMLPATDAQGLTYVVYTEDGESTTMDSE